MTEQGGVQVVELPREDPLKALRCFASVRNLQVPALQLACLEGV